MKITLFQRDISTPLSLDEIKKLALSKSDFLLLPEGFLKTSSNLDDWKKQSSKIEDHILQISESYSGVILGGAFPSIRNGKTFFSTPISQSLSIIDYYDQKQTPNWFQNQGFAHESESIFIMGGLRFGLLSGDDITQDAYLDFFKSENVGVVFHIGYGMIQTDYDLELKFYDQLAKKFKLHIFHVSGYSSQSKELHSLSLYSSPTGTTWKIGKSETQSTVMKTINVNLGSNLFTSS